MIQLIFFLLIGVLLFVSLFFLARRSSRVEGSAQRLLEARQSLDTLQFGLLPTQIVARIFAKDDFDYVLTGSPRPVHELFLHERKKIALCWVNQIRTHILSLKQFHLRSARFYSRLSFRAEIHLAVEFAVLLTACRLVQVMLYVRGPYAAPYVVGTMAAGAAKVCDISEKSLAFLKAPGFESLTTRSAGNPTLS
ncbi:MAG: hypothetical protein ACRD4C_15170 [Candidatus Acidiferrales bacterium]